MELLTAHNAMMLEGPKMCLLQHNTAGSDCLTNEFDVSSDNITYDHESWGPSKQPGKMSFSDAVAAGLGVISGYSWVLECKLDT